VKRRRLHHRRRRGPGGKARVAADGVPPSQPGGQLYPRHRGAIGACPRFPSFEHQAAQTRVRRTGDSPSEATPDWRTNACSGSRWSRRTSSSSEILNTGGCGRPDPENSPPADTNISRWGVRRGSLGLRRAARPRAAQGSRGPTLIPRSGTGAHPRAGWPQAECDAAPHPRRRRRCPRAARRRLRRGAYNAAHAPPRPRRA
jgi:hypothetical protein